MGWWLKAADASQWLASIVILCPFARGCTVCQSRKTERSRASLPLYSVHVEAYRVFGHVPILLFSEGLIVFDFVGGYLVSSAPG